MENDERKRYDWNNIGIRVILKDGHGLHGEEQTFLAARFLVRVSSFVFCLFFFLLSFFLSNRSDTHNTTVDIDQNVLHVCIFI